MLGAPRCFALLSLVFLLQVAGFLLPAQAMDERYIWPPITPEELAMKDDPTNPGALAVILNREQYTDDVGLFEADRYRIKILTDEGRKYAHVEIPLVKDVSQIEDIKARTVRPDGSAVDFAGEIFDKMILGTGRVKLRAKVFTLPDVQVGSIIEYTYKARRPPWALYSTSWIVPRELTTRRAHFSLRPYAGRDVALVWSGCSSRRARVALPPDARQAIGWARFGLASDKAPERRKDGVYHLELENIPPFVEEELMPPADMLKPRISFFYLSSFPGEKQVRTADDFWKQFCRWVYAGTEEFIGERKGIKRAVEEIVDPADPPDAKLRKLYARVQQIRNLSTEQSLAEQEEKQEKLKENQDVEDVLKHGYGSAPEINVLFVALARAAGIDASILYVADRSRWLFQPNLLRWGQLSASIVQVRLGSGNVFLDPSARPCPYGLLPWAMTDTRGLRAEKEGYTSVTTPQPKSADAVIERAATLQMDSEGTLAGNVQVKFVGQEALERRLRAGQVSDARRRKALEDEVTSWLPKGTKVELTNGPNWESSEDPLVAEFVVKIPGLATATERGRRLPLAIFQVNTKYPFQTANRVHPVCFRYPYQELDTITVTLPKDHQVDKLPAPRSQEFPAWHYRVSRRSQHGTLRQERRLVMDGYFFPVQEYSTLRLFYDAVRAGDEQQVVLKAEEAAQPK